MFKLQNYRVLASALSSQVPENSSILPSVLDLKRGGQIAMLGILLQNWTLRFICHSGGYRPGNNLSS